MVFGGGLDGVNVGAEFFDEVIRIIESDGAPVFDDGDIEIEEIIAVEDHVLAVDLGPAHAQCVREGEVFAA